MKVSKQELLRENKALHDKVSTLEQENAQLKKLIFGAKRERFVTAKDPSQTELFEQQVDQRQPVVKEEKTEQAPKKKLSRKGVKRNTFPQNLKRETIVLEPQKIADENLSSIGEDITELLAYRPASLYVKKIIRPRLVDKTNEDRGVLQAPIPPRIVAKGMVDESLIAELISEKIQFHTPVYRFCKKLKQIGIGFISLSNLHNWLHTAAESLIPIYDLLIESILDQGYIQSDETRMIVLAKNKIGASHRGQMWAFMAPTIKAVAFNYEPDRSTESAQVILDRFSGILQVDGYSAYEKIGKRKDIELIYCMAHARRKFFDAKNTDPRADYFLEKVQLLYAIEEQARQQNLTFEERKKLRQQKAVPILNELGDWLSQQYADKTILPKSLLRKAIDYAFKRWKKLCKYAYNEQLEIDNNLVENTIRPIALGRKNYLFAAAHRTAKNLAVLYSIVGTCEKNDINPRKYIHWLLKKVAANKITNEAIQWLPHNIDPKIIDTFDD